MSFKAVEGAMLPEELEDRTKALFGLHAHVDDDWRSYVSISYELPGYLTFPDLKDKVLRRKGASDAFFGESGPVLITGQPVPSEEITIGGKSYDSFDKKTFLLALAARPEGQKLIEVFGCEFMGKIVKESRIEDSIINNDLELFPHKENESLHFGYLVTKDHLEFRLHEYVSEIEQNLKAVRLVTTADREQRRLANEQEIERNPPAFREKKLGALVKQFVGDLSGLRGVDRLSPEELAREILAQLEGIPPDAKGAEGPTLACLREMTRASVLPLGSNS